MKTPVSEFFSSEIVLSKHVMSYEKKSPLMHIYRWSSNFEDFKFQTHLRSHLCSKVEEYLCVVQNKLDNHRNFNASILALKKQQCISKEIILLQNITHITIIREIGPAYFLVVNTRALGKRRRPSLFEGMLFLGFYYFLKVCNNNISYR